MSCCSSSLSHFVGWHNNALLGVGENPRRARRSSKGGCEQEAAWEVARFSHRMNGLCRRSSAGRMCIIFPSAFLREFLSLSVLYISFLCRHPSLIHEPGPDFSRGPVLRKSTQPKLTEARRQWEATSAIDTQPGSCLAPPMPQASGESSWQ